MRGSSLGSLEDAGAVAARLAAGGLTPGGSARAAGHVVRAAACVREALGDGAAGEAEAVAFFVPGRIEVLGKHTDYAGGRSLLVAVERGFSVVRVVGPGAGVRVLDADRGRSVTLEPDPGAAPRRRGWALYPETVARRVARDFGGLGDGSAPARGATIAFSSSLPPASGLSSSSALIAAVYLPLEALWGLEERPGYRVHLGGGRPALAAYLAAVEAGRPFGGLGDGAGAAGVGTEGGSEDHAAILLARAGRVVRYSFLPLVDEGDAALPEGWTFVVAASGVRAAKAGRAREAYNRLAREAAGAAEAWRRVTGGAEPHLGAVLALPDGARRLEETLAGTRWAARARQFAAECGELIPRAARALAEGDVPGFGVAVARSQALGEEVLGNQVPETVELVRTARELGAPAASAFGAGFGGAVWALVEEDRAGGFLGEWRRTYRARFPSRVRGSTFFGTPAGPAAIRVG